MARQVNIRLTDAEYDALLRECPPAATISGYVSIIVREHLGQQGSVAQPVPAGVQVPASRPDLRPFTKEQQTGRKRRR